MSKREVKLYLTDIDDAISAIQTCRICDYADLCGMKEAGGE
jgi:hypothetical protein